MQNITMGMLKTNDPRIKRDRTPLFYQKGSFGLLDFGNISGKLFAGNSSSRKVKTSIYRPGLDFQSEHHQFYELLCPIQPYTIPSLKFAWKNI